MNLSAFTKKTDLTKSFNSNDKLKQDNNLEDSIYFAELRYRLVGPFRGGRSTAVVGDPVQPNVYYFGGTGGGVWKTYDGGNNWSNVSDGYFGGSIGAVAIAPTDDRIVWAGEGENTLRSNESEGKNGIWKSENAGQSWKNMGLADTRHIFRIVVHPTNPNIVWVAAMGHSFGYNNERGVFKTTDGGKTWRKVLFINDSTGCSDLVLSATNPNLLYAGTWQFIRKSYTFKSGGKGSGLYRSTDGGETWQNITNSKGLPTGEWGIVSVSISYQNPNKVYALIENKNGGLYLSNDGGKSWALQCNSRDITDRAWYFSKIFVNPKNDQTIYCLNLHLEKSVDNGKTFQVVTDGHVDHHDLWIDPNNDQRMIVAQDGGAQISTTGGNFWNSLNNQPTAQFYRVSTDNDFPYHILGAQQDNSSVRILSQTYSNGIYNSDFTHTAGFESGYIVADPLNPNIVYGGNYEGMLTKVDHSICFFHEDGQLLKHTNNNYIDVWPDGLFGDPAIKKKYRFQWNFPILFSPTNPKKLYCAANCLFVTENGGLSWEKISPDLTRNDTTKQLVPGGNIEQENTSAEYYSTIFTIAASVKEPNVLWTGSDDGLIYISRDTGATWINVTPPEAPEYTKWNSIETSKFTNGKAYIVGMNYMNDDYHPYIFKTEDYGKTWTKIIQGIPDNYFARVVRADQQREGLLYAGTEYGMFISYNDGKTWHPFQLNLPVVPITDLTIKNNNLVVATQGRAFWVLDNLNFVQSKDSYNLAKTTFCIKPYQSFIINGTEDKTITNAGQNPPKGVVFDFWLKKYEPQDRLTIVINNKDGLFIDSFTNQSGKDLDCHDQMNEWVWNMKYPQWQYPAKDLITIPSPHEIAKIDSPTVPVGQYQAFFYFKNDTVMVPFEICKNPLINLSNEEYNQQSHYLLRIRNLYAQTMTLVRNIYWYQNKINILITSIADNDQYATIRKSLQTLKGQFSQIADSLHQESNNTSTYDDIDKPLKLDLNLYTLYNLVEGNQQPTASQIAVYDLLLNKFTRLKNNYLQLKDTINKINNEVIEQKVPWLMGPNIE